jgi:hypothetical protein
MVFLDLVLKPPLLEELLPVREGLLVGEAEELVDEGVVEGLLVWDGGGVVVDGGGVVEE